MAIKDPTKIQIAVPGNRMDQIVDIVEGTIVVGPATGTGSAGTYASTSASDQKPAIAPDYFYTRGIWSMDGGSSWQQMGAKVHVGDDSVVGQLFLSANASSSGPLDSVPNSIFATANNEGFSGQTVLYKILVMARFDQTVPIPKKKLNQPLRYSTANNYMKIHKENTVLLPTSGSMPPIPHNLGYRPNVMGWILFEDGASGDQFMQEVGDSLSADETNINCDGNSSAFQNHHLYYRVYLDA